MCVILIDPDVYLRRLGQEINSLSTVSMVVNVLVNWQRIFYPLSMFFQLLVEYNDTNLYRKPDRKGDYFCSCSSKQNVFLVVYVCLVGTCIVFSFVSLFILICLYVFVCGVVVYLTLAKKFLLKNFFNQFCLLIY